MSRSGNIIEIGANKPELALAFPPVRFNLFRRRLEPDIYCVVPEDRPVPSFIAGFNWCYAGSLCEGRGKLMGFDESAAEVGFKLSGFHLFQSTASGAERLRPVEPTAQRCAKLA